MVLQSLSLDVAAVPRSAGAGGVEELRVVGGLEDVLIQRVGGCHLIGHGVQHGSDVHIFTANRVAYSIRRNAQHRQLAPLWDLQPQAVLQLEHVVGVLVAVPQLLPLLIVVVEKGVDETGRDAQCRRTGSHHQKLFAVFTLRSVAHHLVKALNTGVEEGHVVGVEHLAPRTASAEVDGHVRRRQHSVHGALHRAVALLHHGHKLRKARRLLHGHVEGLHLVHNLARLCGGFFHRTRHVVKYRGEVAAQRLVLLPHRPVVLDLRQRLGVVLCPRCKVAAVESRRLQVAYRVADGKGRIVSRDQRLVELVDVVHHLRHGVLLRRRRRQCLHRFKQCVVHRHVVELAAQVDGEGVAPLGLHIVDAVEGVDAEIGLILLRIAHVAGDVCVGGVGGVVLQQSRAEAVFAALAHHLHRLLTQRLVEGHQLCVAAGGSAHGLADLHPLFLHRCAEVLKRLTAIGGDVVGIILPQEVCILLGDEPAVHAVLHHVVDVLAHLIAVPGKLRMLPQQPLGSSAAHLRREFIVKHRLVAHACCTVLPAF